MSNFNKCFRTDLFELLFRTDLPESILRTDVFELALRTEFSNWFSQNKFKLVVRLQTNEHYSSVCVCVCVCVSKNRFQAKNESKTNIRNNAQPYIVPMIRRYIYF